MFKTRLFAILTLSLLLIAAPAGATQIRNVVELKGSEQSVLNGIGIVVGLNGTGDGEFSAAHRAVLAATMRMIDPTATPQDFSNSDSIALVAVRAVIPAEGVRSGVDRLDVTVMGINGAESLQGGVLLDTVLFAPSPDPNMEPRAYAVASGPIVLEDDQNPVSARVVRGGHMVADVPSHNLDQNNRITLVIDQNRASWELANFIAQTINGVMLLPGDTEPIAYAVDQKNVIVQVPEVALPNLSDFITQIMMMPIDSDVASGGARVIINQAEGTIAMTGDVELSPVIISHRGMTIQIVSPQPEPDPNNPRIESSNWVAVDPQGRAGTGLRQLLDALNTLNVPAEDRIAIIREIHNLGVLHAELIYR